MKVCFDGNYRSKLGKRAVHPASNPETAAGSRHARAFIDERDISLILGRDAGNRQQAAHAASRPLRVSRWWPRTTRETHGVNDYSLGASMFRRASGRNIEPLSLPGVVDRIGGGDAFAAGFLFAHMTGNEGGRNAGLRASFRRRSIG